MSEPATIVWFRLDLRLADNLALARAVARGGPVLAVFVHAPDEEQEAAPGAASRVWLHHSLAALDQALGRAGARLILRAGPTDQALATLCEETGADHVIWQRRYEPSVLARDRTLARRLAARGVRTEVVGGGLLLEPESLQTSSGGPFQVFSPFWRACLARGAPPAPLPPPRQLPAPAHWPQALPLEALALLPQQPRWDRDLIAHWQPGEAGAERALADFLGHGRLAPYATQRDRPGTPGTSRLSPHLHHGEISPRQLWHAVSEHADAAGLDPDPFLRELGWREFAHHLLFHFPATVAQPLRAAFRNFPWADAPAALHAWQRGRTGYPLVDAGMRELWATGFMHNRVRMVVASFLTKDLLVSWQQGARWFWDTLLDADLANNTLGWQWVAGSGADAAPFFRIFHPVTQGQRFDGDGAYVRRWVPELARLPDRHLQAPWAAPPDVLASAGVRLGQTYPHPIIDHAWARQRALAAYAARNTGRPATRMSG